MTDMHDIREEIWNAITHGLGAILSVAGGSVLITLAALKGNHWQLISAIVFTMALLLLYTASTLYHAIPHLNAKQQLKVFDHCAIYVLIAGSYTPFTLIGLREHGGWWLFGTVWILALAGVIFKLYYTGRFKLVSTLLHRHGLDGGLRHQTDAAEHRHDDVDLVIYRRTFLYARHGFLYEQENPFHAYHLACVRDARQCQPLRGD